MNIVIHLGNHLMAEAIYQLLVKNGYDHVVTSESSPTNGFTPDVLLIRLLPGPTRRLPALSWQ